MRPAVSRKSLQARGNAPREIRTPTVQTDHKALNLAREVPVLSYRRRNAGFVRDDGPVTDSAHSAHGVAPTTLPITTDEILSVLGWFKRRRS